MISHTNLFWWILLLEIPSNNYARHVSCHHVMHPRPSLTFGAFSSPPDVLHLSFQASCWFSEDYKILGIINYKIKSSESSTCNLCTKKHTVGRGELVKNKVPNLCQIIFQWDKFISDAFESRISGSSFLYFYLFFIFFCRRMTCVRIKIKCHTLETYIWRWLHGLFYSSHRMLPKIYGGVRVQSNVYAYRSAQMHVHKIPYERMWPDIVFAHRP